MFRNSKRASSAAPSLVSAVGTAISCFAPESPQELVVEGLCQGSE